MPTSVVDGVRPHSTNHHRFWSHINLTKLTPVGMAEILSGAKIAPLHLEAYSYKRKMERFQDLGKQLEAHISHTRYLNSMDAIFRLWSSDSYHPLLPLNPSLCPIRLTYLPPSPTISSIALPPASQASGRRTARLVGSRLSSRVFESLRYMSFLRRRGLNSIIGYMPRTKFPNSKNFPFNTPPQSHRLPTHAYHAPLPSYPFLYPRFLKYCALALAHLVFPLSPGYTFTSNLAIGKVKTATGDPIRCPKNVSLLQDIESIRSILIGDERRDTEILTWTTPGADVNIYGPAIKDDTSRSVHGATISGIVGCPPQFLMPF